MPVKRKRILVVEDNSRLRAVIHGAFCDKYDVVTVPSASAMEEELRLHAYHLIIGDLNLPDRVSTSVLRQCDHLRVGQEDVAGFGVPAIIITGLDPSDEEFQKARRLPSVQAILQKPLDMEALHRRVDHLLSPEEPPPPLTETGQFAFDTTLHVLVVDDDPQVHAAVSSVLELAGIQVRNCANPAEVARLCRQHRFHLVLVSFMLGGEVADGLLDELCQTLPPGRVPPILVLSDLGEGLTMEHFARFPQVKGCLPRTDNAEELRATAQELLDRLRRTAPLPLTPIPSS